MKLQCGLQIKSINIDCIMGMILCIWTAKLHFVIPFQNIRPVPKLKQLEMIKHNFNTFQTCVETLLTNSNLVRT